MAYVAGLTRLSGAFCPGLIEARRRRSGVPGTEKLSGAFCPGLIEARASAMARATQDRLSGAFCPGLIEAGLRWPVRVRRTRRYPGLFAPASLKRRMDVATPAPYSATLSGAFCPGLIEAYFPATSRTVGGVVIRGFLPRPH